MYRAYGRNSEYVHYFPFDVAHGNAYAVTSHNGHLGFEKRLENTDNAVS